MPSVGAYSCNHVYNLLRRPRCHIRAIRFAASNRVQPRIHSNVEAMFAKGLRARMLVETLTGMVSGDAPPNFCTALIHTGLKRMLAVAFRNLHLALIHPSGVAPQPCLPPASGDVGK